MATPDGKLEISLGKLPKQVPVFPEVTGRREKFAYHGGKRG